MEAPPSFIPVILGLGLGLLVCLLTAFYAYRKLAHSWSFRLLFREFRRKMAMTLGLGMTFLGLYVFCLSLLKWLRPFAEVLLETRRDFIYWIYIALALFIFFSLSIYFVRMIIKYLFLQYGKD